MMRLNHFLFSSSTELLISAGVNCQIFWRGKTSPVSVSVCWIMASFAVLGTITPYLCVFFFKLALTAPIIHSRFLSIKGVHQSKAVSYMSLLAAEYSATWMGYDYFMSLRGTHVSVPYFHSTHTNQPFVVCLRYFLPLFAVVNPSSL